MRVPSSGNAHGWHGQLSAHHTMRSMPCCSLRHMCNQAQKRLSRNTLVTLSRVKSLSSFSRLFFAAAGPYRAGFHASLTFASISRTQSSCAMSVPHLHDTAAGNDLLKVPTKYSNWPLRQHVFTKRSRFPIVREKRTECRQLLCDDRPEL